MNSSILPQWPTLRYSQVSFESSWKTLFIQITLIHMFFITLMNIHINRLVFRCSRLIIIGVQNLYHIMVRIVYWFLAAMSSSRSDSVTHSVRSSVRSFVRVLFCDFMFSTRKLSSSSINLHFEVEAWGYSLKLKLEVEAWS